MALGDHEISWLYPLALWALHSPQQNPDYSRLAQTPKYQGHSVQPWLHQLLLEVHSRLLWYCGSHPTRLTRKGVPWNFSDNCGRSFNRLKEAFICAPVLIHWTLDTPITIETDTSMNP